MGSRKCSHFRTARFNSHMHMYILFRFIINITSRNMASKANRDQIVVLKTAGINNRDIINQLTVCRKTTFNVWKVQRLFNLHQTYSLSKAFDSCHTNFASGYKVSEVKSWQEHEENGKSPRDFKIIYA